MDINLLKKRLKEIQESIAAGVMPAVPGMENLSQPAAPQPVEPYNPPEVNVPTAQPKTTPVSTSPVTQTNNPAVNIPKPTAKMTSNKAKVDPKIINEKNCSFPDHILYFDLGWLQKTGYFKR